MNTTLIAMRPVVRVDLALADLEIAYRDQVGWTDAYRINADARLVLLGIQGLLRDGPLEDEALRDAAFVLGCENPSMASYREFDTGMRAGRRTALAYSHALPSIPLASAALCHQLRGHTYTLVGGPEVGLRVLALGRHMLASRRARHVVAGCWCVHAESAPTRHSGRARIQLALLQPVAAASSHRYCP
ncbi:hypothetical protein [Paraburkholderia terricola]|uniref:3-oxoacyl-(Acyl-carrier-protein) synthase n=1 Tax=Paraburkholderia terricola TaxID=169427 RepID=A0ABU1M279_9BURK|nr:hypothetical protein [Paraburkholderia terricola]MDR6412835.1 3-oxoacyl-(acyl-carrier-protein) synthase [Paraburkholderia terricola]MDR6450043.1 3-oxoacyl-(acyl-carrier-protein) synthase [Paraburkholderia terricola]MDR6484893.1 3-oxoacyl-(acyl-carrier-protein) synthase [Paraburkholderia terricola]